MELVQIKKTKSFISGHFRTRSRKTRAKGECFVHSRVFLNANRVLSRLLYLLESKRRKTLKHAFSIKNFKIVHDKIYKNCLTLIKSILSPVYTSNFYVTIFICS